MIPPTRRKSFAMNREIHLADWFTLANAVCGTGALFSMMSYVQSNRVLHVYLACGLILAALVFDVLGGRVARWRQQVPVAVQAAEPTGRRALPAPATGFCALRVVDQLGA